MRWNAFQPDSGEYPLLLCVVLERLVYHQGKSPFVSWTRIVDLAGSAPPTLRAYGSKPGKMLGVCTYS